MRTFLIGVIAVAVSGCTTKTVCANGSESFRAVLDPENKCQVRIRQVVIGSEVALPKTLKLPEANAMWGYRWVDSELHDGSVKLGHFELVPLPKVAAGATDARK